jgi:hypothetical protein
MRSFDFTSSMENAVEISNLCQEEEEFKFQIADLEIVQQILDTPAWTAQDLLLDQDHRRLADCLNEVWRHELLGRDGFTGPPRGFRDSPFWMCVSEAKDQVIVLLQTHAHHILFQEGAQGAVLANTGGDLFMPFPGGTGQVQIAFHLVTLLYATFRIPLPLSAANQPTETPLWPAMITHDRSHMYRRPPDVQTMPTLRCLHSTAPSFHDVHALKQNLRNDILHINNRYDGLGSQVSDRFPLRADPVMSWIDILRELVGYTKYVQAQATRQLREEPAFYALSELRRLCELETTKTRQALKDLTNRRLEATVTFLKEAEVQEHTDAPPHTDLDLTQQTRVTRLLSRMRSVMNT